MTTDAKLDRPIALVTGSSRGIGRGIAVELASRGWSVVVHYNGNATAADETVQMCRERARQFCEANEQSPAPEFGVLRGNVGDDSERAAMIDEIRRRFGYVDALVNNAGIAPRVRADILEADEDSFDEVMAVNLRGAYFLARDIARMWTTPDVRPAPRGEAGFGMVFVTSISATMVSVSRGEYCISKAGLAMAAQLFAARLAEFGIPVYEVRPGITKTDMTAVVQDKYDRLIADGLVPQRRWGTPEDVGRSVAGLLSGDFGFAPGSVVEVGGGLHIPRL